MGKKDPEVEPVATRWDTLLLVCRKCIRKRDGAADELRRGLRRALRDLAVPERHRIRVVETGCLDVCPKEGVTAVRIGREPAGAVVVLPPPFDPEAAVSALFPQPPGS